MSYSLLIVESPAKCDKIEKYLGAGYRCIASYGHLQELSSLKNIDIKNNFKPTFNPIEKKLQQIARIKNMITNSKEVILATDDDREGEAIAWHICVLFNLSIENTKRIIFHEVTESALKKAVKAPIRLNIDLINAQQGRQILDLLVGFKISPVLWQNISRTKKGLSAGRCQTPAIRLIYENQKDIDNSPGKKVYNTTGYFTDKNLAFTLNYTYDDEDKVIEFLEDTTEHEHVFSCEKPKDSIRKAPQPFTTSGIQQTANNELHISPKETMQICQKLYEGGYITYMRTDCKTYSKEFLEKANELIINKFGAKYDDPNKLLRGANDDASEEKENDKKNKKKSKTKKKDDENIPPPQEAHEAIRPTNVTIENLPDDGDFSGKEIRLYRMIWRNTLESCMSDAEYKIFSAKITAPNNHEYKYLTEQVVFPGWKLVNGYEEINQIYSYLQNLSKTLKSNILKYKKITCKLTIKDLKSHYTEAKLVQLLEQKGIGRPSTFSSLVEKIQERDYVKKENIKGKTITCTDFELENDEILEIENKREFGNEKNKLVIQSIGIMVIEFLLKTYDTLFEYEYTKNMEDILDLIAKGERKYYELCEECLKEIDKVSVKVTRDNKEDIVIDDNHTYMIGKHGPVIKYTDNKANNSKSAEIKFKPVKKDIDLDRLKNGEYELDDILEEANLNRKLGTHQNEDLFLRKGKFGLYVVWGENKKSINDIQIKEADIKLEDVIETINTQNNKNMVREITPDLNIRKGQFGDYIFYKTKKMKKPRFLKLAGFMNDYKNCDINILKQWITETYKINFT
jgi:DNA topoisomerase I